MLLRSGWEKEMKHSGVNARPGCPMSHKAPGGAHQCRPMINPSGAFEKDDQWPPFSWAAAANQSPPAAFAALRNPPSACAASQVKTA